MVYLKKRRRNLAKITTIPRTIAKHCPSRSGDLARFSIAITLAFRKQETPFPARVSTQTRLVLATISVLSYDRFDGAPEFSYQQSKEP